MIRTGSIGLDVALGGGWTPGTLNDVWGDSGSAKTVLAKHSAENAIRAHKDVVWLDLCDSLAFMDDAPGVILARPRNAEEAFMVAYHACKVPEIGLIVFDPAQNLVREIELAGDSDYVPHPQREYRAELNLLKDAARENGTVVLFLSQPRDIQREPIRGTGISEKAAWRVHLHPDVVHQDGSREIQATVKNVRDKSTQHQAARFTVRPGTGIDSVRELVEVAVHYEVIRKSGSWLKYGGGLRAQGVDDFCRALGTYRGQHTRMLLDEDVRRIAGIH